MACKLPNFLIVGAAKSGTSSLYQYLKQHPNIFLPAFKEPRFYTSSKFAKLSPDDPYREFVLKRSALSFQEYKNLSLDVKGENAIGEGPYPTCTALI